MPTVGIERVLDLPLAVTSDRARARRSRWRWLDDGSGIYRLRLRGLLPLRFLRKTTEDSLWPSPPTP